MKEITITREDNGRISITHNDFNPLETIGLLTLIRDAYQVDMMNAKPKEDSK